MDMLTPNRFTWLGMGKSKDNLTGKVTTEAVTKYYVADNLGIILFHDDTKEKCQSFMDNYADASLECALSMYGFNGKSYSEVETLTKVSFGMATNTIRYSEEIADKKQHGEFPEVYLPWDTRD